MSQEVERLAKVRLALEARHRSPLDFWHYSSDQSRQAAAMLRDFDELYARAANKAGKTEWAAAIVLSLLQKRKQLDGAPLPQWRGRVDGICLVLDYNQQKLSVQQTIMRLLGGHPHHARYKQGDILSSLLIQPVGGNDDQSTWSTLTFMSQENKRAGLGARADVIWADEPPVEEIWREARKAAHAGRRIVRLISATPTIRRQWQWLKEEFGDPPRGSVTATTKDWAQARWSLRDNTALTDEEVDKLLREFEKDPLYDARVYGDYVDTTGLCPFDLEALHAMLDECERPELHEWRIAREADDDGTPQGITHVPVEVWKHAEPGRLYYMPIDPSSGVNDRHHDPAGLHVKEMGSGDTVARFNGYLGPYALGVLAAGLARQYNNAVVDPEVNDGWGAGVLRGLENSHYGNVGKQQRLLTPGVWETELGFRTTQNTRPRMISAVQAWVDAWKSGVRYAKCPSRGIIECLLDCILDEDGKIVGAPGVHDEDLILHGQGLARTVTDTGALVPNFPRANMTPEQRMLAQIRGYLPDEHDKYGTAPSDAPLRLGRPAPRT